MKQITTTYKGAEIYFNNTDEVWCGRLDDGDLKPHASLKKLKESIDRAIKKSRKPIPCLKIRINNYNSFMRNVTITSIDADGDVWYTDEKSGRRNKENMNGGYERTWFVISNDVNDKTLIEIYNISDRIEKLKGEIDGLNKEREKKALTLVPYLKNGYQE